LTTFCLTACLFSVCQNVLASLIVIRLSIAVPILASTTSPISSSPLLSIENNASQHL
jgi:hypothetical protein